MEKRAATRRRAAVAAAVVVALAFAAPAALAGTWSESDAGDLPATAEAPSGLGALTSLSGSLAGPADEDVYQLCIDGGGTFSASTLGTPGSFDDVQLFLFDSAGMGVYANDDNTATRRAHLPAGDALTPTAPGVYYLAVSSYDNDPVSTGGLIFPSFPYTDLYGPTNFGGGLPVSGWMGTAETSGTYTVALTGASFCTLTVAATVEVKPGSAPAPLNTKAKGVTPVAVLTDATLDAATVDPTTVCFGDDPLLETESDCAEAHETGHLEDVDGDGDLDLVLHFDTQALGLEPGDTQACLSGETYGGARVTGCDTVTVR